ncbi:hypothetical protein L218DRAFT_1001391 [Marasmius fiardii PR-910]|nr:hypothetical protein L218DRAFT_1001391 [Marasmius fiardii PR-910]
MPTNETTVSFITAILGSVLYGVSLILLAVAVKTVVRPSFAHWKMLVLVFTFFVLSTIGFITILHSNIMFTVLVRQGILENTADGFKTYSRSSAVTSVLWRVFGMVASAYGPALLADAVVIYRSYMVWRNKWVLIVPSFSWICLFASTVGAVHACLRVGEDTSEREQILRYWVIASLCLSLSTNFISTGLLAYKVYSTEREAKLYRLSHSTTSMAVVRVIVESGTLYSVWLIVGVVLIVVGKQDITRVFLSTSNSIIPITFYLLIIRVEQAFNRDPADTGSRKEPSIAFRTTTESDFTDFTITSRKQKGSNATHMTTDGRGRNGSVSTILRRPSVSKSHHVPVPIPFISPPASPTAARIVEHGYELAIRPRLLARTLSNESMVTFRTLEASTPSILNMHTRRLSQDSCVVVTVPGVPPLVKTVPDAAVKNF